MPFHKRVSRRVLLSGFAALAVASCGGGGGSSTPTPTPAVTAWNVENCFTQTVPGSGGMSLR